MTSSNGNIFRVTGYLCGEFTVPRWIPRTKPATRSFCVFFDVRLNKRPDWVNNDEAGDLRRHSAHYDVIEMIHACGVTLCVEAQMPDWLPKSPTPYGVIKLQWVNRGFWPVHTVLNTVTSLHTFLSHNELTHYTDVIMGTMASQITSLTIVYSTVYSGEDQRKHQSSASLAVVWGIHRGSVNSPHKWPVTRKMFPFDNVIMFLTHWDRYTIAAFFQTTYSNGFSWINIYQFGL